MTTENVDF